MDNIDKKNYTRNSNDDLNSAISQDSGLNVDRDNAEWDRLSRRKQDPTRHGVPKRNMRATAQYNLDGHNAVTQVGSTDKALNGNISNLSNRKGFRNNVSDDDAYGKNGQIKSKYKTEKNVHNGVRGESRISDSALKKKKTTAPLPRDNKEKADDSGNVESPRTERSVVSKNSNVAVLPKQNDIIRVRGGIDRPMLIIVIALICFGLVMVFSASYAYSLSKTGDSFYYIKRQAGFAFAGLVAMVLAVNVDYQWIKKVTVVFFLVMVVFLIITPIYGLAAGVATRWIDIGGFRFQPSEVMKLALVLILALYFSKYEKLAQHYDDFWLSSVYGLFLPAGIVGFVCILIMLENHFSCMIIMFLIGMIVIFSAGARKFWFVVVGGGGAVAALIAISLSSYARERIDVWLNPQNYAADDEVYQTLQGLYAVGSGGFLGVGLGNSRQKHLFVSQPQNDFIFSIICEELGFVGAVGVIALFILLVWRGVVIALRAPDTYSQLVVIGIVGKVAIQALLNIGVVTSLLPNTGISLPFFSYGGSALMMQIGEMGIVLGISKYSRKT